MQLEFAEETFTSEFQELLNLGWDKENPEHEPLDINWPLSTQRILDGVCRAFTARNLRGRLVGQCFYLIVTHPHHKTYKIAECDMINVDPRLRGMGIGRRLMQHAEPLLVSAEVKEITHRYKHSAHGAPLFQSLGYFPIETVFSKKVA